jgi:hypothetical protein
VNFRSGGGLVVAGLPAISPNQFAIALVDETGAMVSHVNPAIPCGGEVAVAEEKSGLVAYAAGAPGPLCLVFIDPISGSTSPALRVEVPPPAPGYPYGIPYGEWVRLYGLAGGGVAIFVNGVPAWIASPSTNTIEAAPAWLASHAGESFHLVRRGAAQALVRSNPDSAEITVVSADGERCGTITVTGFRFADLGFDGTLVGSTGGRGTVKVWWTGLLR